MFIWGVPAVVQWDWWCLWSTGTQVRSLAWHSELKICHCHRRCIGRRCGSDLIPGPETPYATGQPRKKKKKKIESLLSILLAVYLGEVLLGHTVVVCLTFRRIDKLFSQELHHFTTPATMCEGAISLKKEKMIGLVVRHGTSLCFSSFCISRQPGVERERVG